MLKKIFYIFLGGLLLSLIYSSYIYVTYNPKPLIYEVEKRYSSSILDKDYNLIHMFLNNKEEWHLKSEDPIPDALKIAVMNYEDKEFYNHIGVNFKSILRAAKTNVLKGKKIGASTITMQVVKFLEPKKRTYFNKYKEIIQAIKLEKYLSKDEILNLYLNNAPYGGNIVGYKTASYMYFNKPPKSLSWAEGVLLAVLPNSPSLLNIEKNREKLLEKRNRELKNLKNNNYLDELQFKMSLKEDLPEKKHYYNKIAAHFSRRIKNKNREKIIETNLDTDLQHALEEIVKNYSKQKAYEGINNAAVIVIENKTRNVLAYIGSQDFKDDKTNGQVDGIKALRSPGSTLKPFLYALAMDEGIISSKSKYPDVPMFFKNFSPSNSDLKYRAMVSMDMALKMSLNIPFVKLLQDYGVDNFFYFMKDVLDFKDKNHLKYGLSLILGTKEISVEDLSKLYLGLANYGEFYELNYTKEESKNNLSGKRLISKGASYLTLNTMKEVIRPSYENRYKNIKPVSWKTGTSYGNKDAWTAGSTTEHTVIIWLGNFNGKSSPELTGIKTAAPLFFNIINRLSKETKDFEIPDGELKTIKVDKETGFRLSSDLEYEEILYPKYARALRLSPYYKKVYLNSKNEVVDSRSKDFLNAKPHYQLSYPIDVINYMIKERMDISGILKQNKEKSIKIVYPLNGLEVLLTQDLSEKNDLVIKIANLKNKKIYWYINNTYIDSSRETERVLKLEEGENVLTIVSEDGETDKVRFTLKNTKQRGNK